MVSCFVELSSNSDMTLIFVYLFLADNGKMEVAVGVYWVTDGIDRCLVGYLPRHLIKFRDEYDGRVAQVVEFLKLSESSSQRSRSHRNRGMCTAAFLQLPNSNSN
jgi:hypothetical protein